MEEVFAAADHHRDRQVEIRRVGRDMPGSNSHTYIRDPDGHTVELYYGMEQISWDGRSKPESIYYRALRETPELPQMSEAQEVREAIAKGIDIDAGNIIDGQDRRGEYIVAGVKLPRPFKVHEHRADEPVRLRRRRVGGLLHLRRWASFAPRP